MKKIKSLHIYPIKSLGGIELNKSAVSAAGLQHDRRWMLVDAENNFMTQRTKHELCLFKQHIQGERLFISYKGEEVSIPLLQAEGKLEQALIWEHDTTAFEVDPAVSAWFTKHINIPCRLMRMNHAHYRFSKSAGDLKMNFADGYPLLFIGTASLDFLNGKLAEQVPMNRFRPNVVYTTEVAHEEDELGEFSLGTAQFKGSHPCGRCVVTTINQVTGTKSKEPLRTMNTYRKVPNEGRVNFGMNVYCTQDGVLKIGDSIQAQS